MKKITFSRQVNARGKNGWIKQSGLGIVDHQRLVIDIGWLPDKIELFPITSNGLISDSCIIEIPTENIREVALALLESIGLFAPLWGIIDIQDRAKERGFEVTKEQAQEIAEKLVRRHDPEYGITWQHLDNELDDYDPELNKEEYLEDFVGDVFTPEQ